MNSVDTEHFSIPLLDWYDRNKRDMVWRDRMNPYYTWISEIMLQQTRIEAATGYFIRFIEELPDIQSLAHVPEERLMKLWEGLGYYNRARNLKRTAQILMEEYDGRLPADYDKLMTLPGIGPYTAGAIASISYGIKAPAVDGNVFRVLMRYLRCDDDISKMSVRRRVERMLLDVMPERPGDFNQAVMELGEVICIPNGAPLCEKCPLMDTCQARAAGCQEDFPKKAEKKPRRIENRTLLVYELDGYIGIQRRPQSGLLAGLYEFPAVTEKLTLKGVKERLEEQGILNAKICSMGTAKHVFSHVEWHMKGFYVKLERAFERQKLSPNVIFVSRDELSQNYALPTAFRYYLKQIVEGKNEK